MMVSSFCHKGGTEVTKGAPCIHENAPAGYAIRISARSYHPGGVNVCRGDGSVGFFANTINRQIWRGFGSSAGAEVLNLE